MKNVLISEEGFKYTENLIIYEHLCINIIDKMGPKYFEEIKQLLVEKASDNVYLRLAIDINYCEDILHILPNLYTLEINLANYYNIPPLEIKWEILDTLIKYVIDDKIRNLIINEVFIIYKKSFYADYVDFNLCSYDNKVIVITKK